MFQKFITCFSDKSYISYGFMYMLFLRLTVFFLRHHYIPVFHVIAMQRFDFKISSIASKLFRVIELVSVGV